MMMPKFDNYFRTQLGFANLLFSSVIVCKSVVLMMDPSTDVNTQCKKRKRPVSADPYTRMMMTSKTTTATTTTSNNSQASRSGRGSEAGWTQCPLCGRHSKKLFAMGRGIASHLHAVHTPWNPGKIERQKRRRLAERRIREMQQQQQHDEKSTMKKDQQVQDLLQNDTWEPSEQEIEDWNSQVLQIVRELEEAQNQHTKATNDGTNDSKPPNGILLPDKNQGMTRNGQTAQSYRESLPPFLKAAAKGDLTQLKQILDSKQNDNKAILEEVNRVDRHLSTAEHWAAGGGHLECLQYLIHRRTQLMQVCHEDVEDLSTQNKTNSKPPTTKKVRRRDGKTSLHYAARNGHVHCIRFLIEEQGHVVDETSGDGTTPFHLACFGGHLEAMEALLQQHKCNPLASNDWGCNAGHWMSMTKNGHNNVDNVRRMCHLLQREGVSFVQRQKQGHTALHKAAQRLNHHVIEWLAQSRDKGGAGLSDREKKIVGEPDEGGHKPSQIWRSVGGDEEFGDWMEKEMGW